MFKIGLMKFNDTPACIEVVVSYHVENYEAIIDSVLWNVYKDSISKEFVDIHHAHPDYICPHVCMGNESLCPFICPHKTFDSAKKACDFFNSFNKRKLLVRDVQAEADKLMHSIYKEQASAKWEADIKSFRDEFKDLVKKYGMEMEVTSDDYGEEIVVDSIQLKRKWNSLGESMCKDLIYLLSND